MKIFDKFIYSYLRKTSQRNTAHLQIIFTKKFTSSKFKKKYLNIHPLTCLQDEPIEIRMKNLIPESEVTLTSRIKDFKGQFFFTYTHYCADSSGNINLENDASIGGTYKGVFPMGPIAHLEAGPNEYKYLRFSKRDVTTPLQVNFQLLNGHLDAKNSFTPEDNLVMDRVTHERVYLTPGTERIPIKTGRVRGTLFLPKGDGPFPGVIDLYGSSGGLVEFRAAQFAARGIASLALAYFGYEDLPNEMEYIDLSYFEEAVNILLSNKKVKKDGVGAVGLSKGGDLVCSMGAFIPEVKAVVCINGIPVNLYWPLKIKEKIIPYLPVDSSKAKVVSPELTDMYDMIPDSKDFPKTYLPLHTTDAQFMFIIVTDDKNAPTKRETLKAVERMKKNGASNYEIFEYKGAGHLLEPPYTPFAYATYHKMISSATLWGGFAKDHIAAAVDSWDRVIKFLNKVLG